jgi:flagellar biogenesis protein FliO
VTRAITIITSAYLLLPHIAMGAQDASEQTTSPALIGPELGGLETTFSIIKIIAAFLVVAGAMALVFKLMQKIGPGSLSKTGLIDILDTKMIAPKKYISVVRIADQDMAIAISENNISLLCPLTKTSKPKTVEQNSEFNQAMQQAATQEESSP